MRILLADDDERIVRLISDILTLQGYEVITAKNGKVALDQFNINTFDLIILDVMMPIYDGWIVCKEIRKKSNVPIMMLTARDSELDELFGFEVGVDDYIAKPFSMDLLLARMKRLLKRNQTQLEVTNDWLTYGILQVDFKRHLVKVDEELIDLSPKEFDLLQYFIENKSIVISRDNLIESIWHDDFFGETRTVDTHITRLRTKLKEAAKYIKTVRGYGYKFEV